MCDGPDLTHPDLKMSESHSFILLSESVFMCIYCSEINHSVIYSNLSSVTFILKTHCVVVGRQKNGTLALEKLKSWVNSSPELGQTFIKMIFAQVKNTYFLPSFQVSSSTFRPGVCFHHLLSIFQDYSQDVIGFSIFLMKTVEWLGTQTLNEPHCKRSTVYRSYFSKGDL